MPPPPPSVAHIRSLIVAAARGYRPAVLPSDPVAAASRNLFANERMRHRSTAAVSLGAAVLRSPTESRSDEGPTASPASVEDGDADDDADPGSAADAAPCRRVGHLALQYQSMVSDGSVKYDVHQIQALEELDRLRDDILGNAPGAADGEMNGMGKRENGSNIGDGEERESATPWPSSSAPSPAGEGGMLSGFGSFFTNLFSASDSGAEDALSGPPPPRGCYLHGGVGCGKTFCMDLFYGSIPEGTMSKQKVHFHKFMLGVHKQMHEAKMVEGIEGDVLPRVIERTIKDGRLICFDEFQVTDVADALILRRLFTGLLEQGAIFVATSNRPPRDLYMNGLQRDRFVPFIDLLEERTEVISMWESETDYRLVQGEAKAKGVYFIGPKSKVDYDQVYDDMCEGFPSRPTSLSTQGRSVKVRAACLERSIARFSFDDLCKRAMGAADYLAIAETFHTVFVDDVPAMTMNEINWVRRFITLVDVMYECRVKLVLHAQTLPRHLFFVDLDNQFQDEAFAFDRTRSRLDEMGGESYLKRRWVGVERKKREGRPDAVVGPEPGLQY